MSGPTLTRVAPFNVDAVDVVAVRGATICGGTHDVLQLTTGDMRILKLLEEDPNAVPIDDLVGVVARCVPTLTAQELDTLRPQQVGQIIGLAQITVREVEAQVPNAEGPTETSDQSPPA